MRAPAPRVAVCDYRVTTNTASGSCHRAIVEGLAEELDFTVVATAFDDPTGGRARWLRVRAVNRPLLALFVTFYVTASLRLARARRAGGFDLVQVVEGNAGGGSVVYAHSCHKALRARSRAAALPSGVRGLLRRLDYRLRLAAEPSAYRRAKVIVVPSEGAARDLREVYPDEASKVQVVPNPVDVEKLRRPPDFDRERTRADFGWGPADVVLAFSALGMFEWKGLGLLLEALGKVDPAVRLVVVGGTRDEVAAYRRRAHALDAGERVTFLGFQRDVRPVLWAADAFVLPSFYETFSLVSFEAAAAGLPLVVTALHGVEDFFRSGEHGFLVERDAASIADGLGRLVDAGPDRRNEMGQAAAQAVAAYGPEAFVASWRRLYRELLA